VVVFGAWCVNNDRIVAHILAVTHLQNMIMFFGAKCWLLFVCGFYIRTLVRLLFSEQCVGYNGADVANIYQL